MARGGCGSPTCADPHCKVRRGYCHRDDCERPAAIANQTKQRDRHIADEATLYCSPRCATLDRNRGDAYRESKRELETAGYGYNTGSVEKILGRSKPVICKRAKELNVGRHIVGSDGQRGPLRFRKKDIDKLKDELRRWDHLTSRAPDLGEYGRNAPVIARQHGKRVGRRPSYTDDEAEFVRQLGRKDLSLRQIANKSGLSKDQVRRVLGRH
jgi:hypothetical protein